jgi:hypothetical protein
VFCESITLRYVSEQEGRAPGVFFALVRLS